MLVLLRPSEKREDLYPDWNSKVDWRCEIFKGQNHSHKEKSSEDVFLKIFFVNKSFQDKIFVYKIYIAYIYYKIKI